MLKSLLITYTYTQNFPSKLRGRYGTKFSIFSTTQFQKFEKKKKIRPMFSSFNPILPSLPKLQTKVDSFSGVKLSLVTKLKHHSWAYVNTKLS